MRLSFIFCIRFILSYKNNVLELHKVFRKQFCGVFEEIYLYLNRTLKIRYKMTHISIEKFKLSSKDREKEELKRVFRRKALLILIHHHLEEYGYVQAASTLKDEVAFPIEGYKVSDNIHLESILQDFESYYFLKYQKFPQIVKKITEDQRRMSLPCAVKNNRLAKKRQSFSMSSPNDKSSLLTEDSGLISKGHNFKQSTEKDDANLSELSARHLEAFAAFENCNDEWKAMSQIILQDFAKPTVDTQWSDIIGHEKAKQILQEAITYPLKYEHIFSTLITPWKGILLHGPPGTGKTLLARAAASQCNTTFFNVSASTLLSKWRGESEKLIKVLFELAKLYAPSVIFIDEVDSLLGHRGNDHEASKRLKTEFFIQMDNLLSHKKLVFILAATNMPWELDPAIVRRLEKRILVPLPNMEERILLFQKFLPKLINNDHIAIKTDLNYKELADKTKNYSAADIELVCRETKMNSLRAILGVMENIQKVKSSQKLPLQPIQNNEVLEAITRIKPAATDLASIKYTEWDDKHGSK